MIDRIHIFTPIEGIFRTPAWMGFCHTKEELLASVMPAVVEGATPSPSLLELDPLLVDAFCHAFSGLPISMSITDPTWFCVLDSRFLWERVFTTRLSTEGINVFTSSEQRIDFSALQMARMCQTVKVVVLKPGPLLAVTSDAIGAPCHIEIDPSGFHFRAADLLKKKVEEWTNE